MWLRRYVWSRHVKLKQQQGPGSAYVYTYIPTTGTSGQIKNACNLYRLYEYTYGTNGQIKNDTFNK